MLSQDSLLSKANDNELSGLGFISASYTTRPAANRPSCPIPSAKSLYRLTRLFRFRPGTFLLDAGTFTEVSCGFLQFLQTNTKKAS
jgi:hypothetical protein